MAEESCGNCRFKHAYQPQPNIPTVTICRRYPPKATIIVQNFGPPPTITYWPGPNDTDWCGEYRPITGAAIKPFQIVGGEPDAST